MPETQYKVARTPRFSFVAEARRQIWAQNKSRIVTRISELSAQGCYVDTVNPFPMDTELHFLIRYICSTSYELSGKVIYTHSGFGIGVSFADIAPIHRHAL